MRRTRYIISGLLLIALPILLAQVLKKKNEPEIVKKIEPPPPRKANPLLQQLLVDYIKQIVALIAYLQRLGTDIKSEAPTTK